MGLAGFALDSTLTGTGVALRLLLQPSFHPEVCITLVSGESAAKAYIVVGQTMVWRLPQPGSVLTYRDSCGLDLDTAHRLIEQFGDAIKEPKTSGVMIDGMPVDTMLLNSAAPALHVRFNAGVRDKYASFVADVAEEVWHRLNEPDCRNSLAQATKYAGRELPLLAVTARKPVVRTMVLGSPEDRQELLEALKSLADQVPSQD